MTEARPAATATEAAFRPFPSKLFVETTTRCNLRCPMCVKQAADSQVVDGDLAAVTFAALEPAFPYLESLVLNGIGEPLMHPLLPSWIHRARQLMPETGWIGFQSNGLFLDRHLARELVVAGLDRICLSVDGVHPETFSKVRQGESLGDMERAFAVLADARHACPNSRLRVGAEFVTLRENLHQLPDTVRWIAERGADFLIVSQALPYGPEQTRQTTYNNANSAAVALFEVWKRKLATQNLDIHLYDYMSWEKQRLLHKTIDPRTPQVNALVNKMRTEANQRGIYVDVKQLLRRDTALQEQMEDLYRQAQQVADRVGIELKLPVTVPRSERKCDFVAGGSAFISWYGGVHPCYQLWHNYQCYINDWDRPVRVREFGRVQDTPLLEIWNGNEFRTFRENVSRFDYPYCTNCGVAPCDLLQREDFDHDCFANTEPCGSCQWAMGLLKCLQ